MPISGVMGTQNDKLQYFIAAVLLVAILILLSGRGHKNMSSMIPALQSDQQTLINNKINLELKQTDLKSEIKIKEIEIENAVDSVLSHDVNEETVENLQPDLPAKVNPLEFEQENPGEQVLQDINYEKRKSRALTPEQRITTKLERDAWVREQEKIEQEVMVKKIIQNARDKGVELRVNKNLDVIGVSPAPKEEPLRIPQSVQESSGSAGP